VLEASEKTRSGYGLSALHSEEPDSEDACFFFKKTKMDLTLLNLRPVSSVVVSVK